MGRRWRRNFEEFVADRDGAVEVLLQRLAGGETMEEICWSRQIPPSLVASWIAGDVELAEACGVAERLYVDREVKKAQRIVDGEEGKPGEFAGSVRDRVEFRKWLAGKLNRRRYGEERDRGVPVVQIQVVKFVLPEVVLPEVVDAVLLEEL